VVLAGLDEGGVLRYRAVDSCLVFLPMVHGKQVITIENLRDSSGTLHSIQRAMIDAYGSQCGFCTPGMIMSLFALHKSSQAPSREQVVDAVAGNLCRCTGYRSIIDAGLSACGAEIPDHFTASVPSVQNLLRSIANEDLCIDTGQQRYVRPATLAGALKARQDYPEALVISGATDVALRVTKKHEFIKSIIDLSGVSELTRIERSASGLRFGAAATMQDVLDASAEKLPPLAVMLRVFGSRQIRNMATIGGNIGTASPIGDTLPVLIALRADVEVTGPAGHRSVPIDEMLVGYRRNACGPEELITGVYVPVVPDGTIVRVYKISRRNDLDISTVSAAFRIRLDGDGKVSEAVLAYGGMAATPRRALRAEQFLAGKPWTRGVVEESMRILPNEFTPLRDVRGSASFRTTISQNLLLKFWDETAGASGVRGTKQLEKVDG
jgi:xanthine dehydrogenase small subunit